MFFFSVCLSVCLSVSLSLSLYVGLISVSLTFSVYHFYFLPLSPENPAKGLHSAHLACLYEAANLPKGFTSFEVFGKNLTLLA